MYTKDFKVMFLGSPGIGAKTSLINNIIKHSFDENTMATSFCSYVLARINTQLGEISLDLWDSPGQRLFHSTTKLLFKDTDCFIIGFDITMRSSFNEVEYFYKLIKEQRENIPLLYLVGNKSDLFEKRNVSEEEAEEYAKEKKIKYFEVSAKTGYNVDALINDIANSLIQNYKKEHKQDKTNNINKANMKKKCLIF